MLWHLLTHSHAELNKDGVGRIIVCERRWNLARFFRGTYDHGAGYTKDSKSGWGLWWRPASYGQLDLLSTEYIDISHVPVDEFAEASSEEEVWHLISYRVKEADDD